MDMTELLKIIGQRIKLVRKSKKISQEQMAELAGLHPTYISHIERGKVNASLYSYYMVAKALKVPLSEIVDIPAKSKDKSFDDKLVAVIGLAKELDRNRQAIFLSVAQGALNGIRELTTRKSSKP
jgi:transcriptional regulator with XRE-family HTH domain